MLKLLKMMKRSGVVLLIIAAAFIVLQTYCDLQIPVYMQRILSIAQNTAKSNDANKAAMIAQIPGTLSFLLGSFLFAAASIILSSIAISKMTGF